MTSPFELDAQVAKEVMGYEVLDVGYFGVKEGLDSETPRQRELKDWMCKVDIESIGTYYICAEKDFWVSADLWKPSEDIGLAFSLLRVLEKEGWRWAIQAEDPGYGYSIDLRLKPCGDCGRDSGSVYLLVQTWEEIPAMICRVAVEARRRA